MELGGTKTSVAPATSISPATLVAAEIVHDDDVAGAQRRHQERLDIGLEERPLIPRSSTIGATIPFSESPATSVVVFQ